MRARWEGKDREQGEEGGGRKEARPRRYMEAKDATVGCCFLLRSTVAPHQ